MESGFPFCVISFPLIGEFDLLFVLTLTFLSSLVQLLSIFSRGSTNCSLAWKSKSTLLVNTYLPLFSAYFSSPVVVGRASTLPLSCMHQRRVGEGGF